MRLLEIGDPAPWFSLPSTVNPLFHFSTVGGKRIVLFFFGSTAFEPIKLILKSFQNLQPEFEQLQVLFFGVSIDSLDKERNLPSEIAPSFIFFWDFERTVSTQYALCQDIKEGETNGIQYAPRTFILNENLCILNIFSMGDPAEHAQKVLHFLKTLPPIEEARPATRHAPVLVIPNVLDRAFCRSLIDFYKAEGGTPSGFMRQVDGKTLGLLDDSFKKRQDVLIEDRQLQRKLGEPILRRVCPEVEKAFQFKITRFERYLIGCYDANSGGYFRAHRDNTTKATLHRRFAMTLNLNVGEYTGGYLRFPEYSPNGYRHETGTAIVFSCSLLHEATPVISGQRFALLSFFYNDEDAKVRETNLKYLSDEPPSKIG
ncbi:bacteriocin transporter [Oscillatoriales cyanobacterium USR001]|nr:bacteriocin transporter [Oscillatoriales cyanobacterium USR001]